MTLLATVSGDKPPDPIDVQSHILMDEMFDIVYLTTCNFEKESFSFKGQAHLTPIYVQFYSLRAKMISIAYLIWCSLKNILQL